jgi:hypothetical protein
MSLYIALKNIVPDKNDKFNYLRFNGCSYFSKWHTDVNKQIYLYYWFYDTDKIKKNIKRVVINELEELLRYSMQNNISIINRKLFESICNTTYRDGLCGYCVSIRLFEFLGIAEYQGSKGFSLTNKEKIKHLLGELI